jgi:hypothetical protein
VFGSGGSQIATLVERQTRYVMLVKVAGKDTHTMVTALVRHARKLPQELYKSLASDRGKKLAAHKRFTLATDIKVYFCDPQSPWQRGTNENTNGLLRQYLPEGLDISGYSQASLDVIARTLNERPRKTLDYKTPAEMFNDCVRRPVESASSSGHLRVEPQANPNAFSSSVLRLNHRVASPRSAPLLRFRWRQCRCVSGARRRACRSAAHRRISTRFPHQRKEEILS